MLDINYEKQIDKQTMLARVEVQKSGKNNKEGTFFN